MSEDASELSFATLSSSLSGAPEAVQARVPAIIDLFARKQWHQLTFALLDFVQDPRASVGDNLLQVRASAGASRVACS
jgi:hypothetical protein